MVPLPVVRVVSPVAVTVQLPEMWQVHPTFHVEKLKLLKISKEFQREVVPPPLDVDNEGHLWYEVQAIIQDKGKGKAKKYLVMWKGYLLHEASWEPKAHLLTCTDLLFDYLKCQAGGASEQHRGQSCRK